MEKLGQNSLFVKSLNGEQCKRAPFWFMRQAGRYLPEYRQVRNQSGGFLDLCFHKQNAVDVTMQPIARYGMDAAILFSDILVIPLALGQNLWFEEGEGPKLEALKDKKDLEALSCDYVLERLGTVIEITAAIRKELDPSKALIGFAGAPWTVATYMLEGGSSKNYLNAKAWRYQKTALFDHLMDVLIESTARYLIAQIKAGANVVQLFDSWAGALDETSQRLYSLAPLRAIAARIKAVEPQAKVIVFAKGVGSNLEAYAKEPLFDGLSLDHTVSLDWAKNELQDKKVLQGNMDPILLVSGGDMMLKEAQRICETLGPSRHIFNLSHGIVPQTSPEHVALLSEFLRSR